MTISARLLRKWRKEALRWEREIVGSERMITNAPVSELYKQILAMTSELLDQHLLKERK